MRVVSGYPHLERWVGISFQKHKQIDGYIDGKINIPVLDSGWGAANNQIDRYIDSSTH